MSKFILDICQEECAEVIQAISKVKRFGLYQVHPDTGVSNKQALEEELGQLQCMISKVMAELKLDVGNILNNRANKDKALSKWAVYEDNPVTTPPIQSVPNPEVV
jgi:NTP pyrophosphatase (non-canonical NTP hydrolase)